MQKKVRIPHTYVIVFGFILLAAIMTWILPAGEFDRTTKITEGGKAQTVIVENSFRTVEQSPQTWQVLSSIFNGFVNQANIIVFILLIGGAFG